MQGSHRPDGFAARRRERMQKNCNGDNLRIAIIDNHTLFVDAIRALLERESDLTIIGSASNRIAARDLVRLQPQIILLEIELGSENSLDFFPDLIRVAEGARILVV